MCTRFGIGSVRSRQSIWKRQENAWWRHVVLCLDAACGRVDAATRLDLEEAVDLALERGEAPKKLDEPREAEASARQKQRETEVRKHHQRGAGEGASDSEKESKHELSADHKGLNDGAANTSHPNREREKEEKNTYRVRKTCRLSESSARYSAHKLTTADLRPQNVPEHGEGGAGVGTSGGVGSRPVANRQRQYLWKLVRTRRHCTC